MTDAPRTYTTSEAAAALVLKPSRVRQLAKALKIGQTRQEQRGPVRTFSAADIDVLRLRNTQVGRPRNTPATS